MQKDYYKNQSSDQTTLLKFSNDFLTPLIGFVSRWNNAANVLALSGGDRFLTLIDGNLWALSPVQLEVSKYIQK